MELPDEFPDNINYGWYVAEAKEVLRNVNYSQLNLFSQEAA
jgi:hypothetical protein